MALRQLFGDPECGGEELDGTLVDVQPLVAQHANVSGFDGVWCASRTRDEDEDEDEDGAG